MSVKDFSARSGHPVDDPESLVRWLDLIPRALNIDDHIEVTSPALADEVDIFNVAAGKRRKVTLTNLLALGGVPANITCTSINFGQTSLSYYGEGTWTPIDSSGAALSFGSVNASYTRVGNRFFADFFLTYPATVSGVTAVIGGLPFTTKNETSSNQGNLSFTNSNIAQTIAANSNNTTFQLYTLAGGNVTNVQLTGGTLVGGVHSHL